MNFFQYQKPFAVIVLVLFLSVEVFSAAVFVLIPRQAKATYPTITIANLADALWHVLEGVAITMATRIVNRFLTEFVDRVYEKFKIRNFLYYDQVLTNYYLTRYLADKISDPDLRRIYQLLNAAYVTGDSPYAGTNLVPRRDQALIPVINREIDNYMRTHLGKLTPQTMQGLPPMNVYQRQDFEMYYYSNPYYEYSDQMMPGNFANYQSSSGIASKLENMVGDGLKSSRMFGAHCENMSPDMATPGEDPNSSQAACQRVAGTWVPGQGNTSFLTDPAGMIQNYVQNAVGKIFDANYDVGEKNIWIDIGSLLGNFLATRLLSNTAQGTPLNEDPNYSYAPGGGFSTSNCNNVDIGTDGIPDQYTCSDGTTVCIYGSNPAGGCTDSATASNPQAQPDYGSNYGIPPPTVTVPPTTPPPAGNPYDCGNGHSSAIPPLSTSLQIQLQNWTYQAITDMGWQDLPNTDSAFVPPGAYGEIGDRIGALARAAGYYGGHATDCAGNIRWDYEIVGNSGSLGEIGRIFSQYGPTADGSRIIDSIDGVIVESGDWGRCVGPNCGTP